MIKEEKIAQAKARLMLEHPYFGTIAASLEILQSDAIEAFESDGRYLRLNTDFVESAGVEEVEFALANGAMHRLLRHEERANDRQGRLWQLATDYTINTMLIDNGLALPQRANFHERFGGMYAEEVYEILRSEILDESYLEEERDEGESDSERQEQLPDRSEQTEQAQSGESRSALDGNIAKEQRSEGREEEEPEMQIDEDALDSELFFEQLFSKMSRQGTLPRDLKRLVPRYFSHRVDWREMLYRHIASYAKSSFTFVPPNMKTLYRGIYLPSLSSDLLRIVIAIDTSGSVDEALLGRFLDEVTSITQQYANYEIDLIAADARIQSHTVFLPGETLTCELKGGHGTDFRPVFAYIDRAIDHPTLLIYFTDGYGTFPDLEPPYDLLWVMAERIDVSFGEVIEIGA